MKNYGAKNLEKRTFGFSKKFQVEEKIFKISLICVPKIKDIK